MIMANGGHTILVLLIVLLLLMEILEYSLGVGLLNVRCPETERDALLNFKQGLGLRDDRNQLSSWVSDEDCCQWKGVGCSNKTGHVIKLDLRSMFPYDENHLRGEISPSLLELQHLSFLDLSYNFFGDIRIPNFIGSFAKLRYLNLSYAGFSGNVPPQLGNASRLRFLDIGNNFGLHTLNVDNLEWLSRLSSLRYVDMSNVNLSKAVDWLQAINMLPHLSELRLRGCELPKVPASPLHNVNSKMSPAIFDHSENNNKSSTFYWLFNVSSSLMHLDLSLNNFGGGISRFLANICELRGLDLSWNNLEGEMLELSRSWSRCSRDIPLESLKLHANQLSGHLPDFTRLWSLKELYLGMNRLNGTLPDNLGQLSKLNVLDLSSNSLDGFVSDTHLCNLSSLKELYLSSNSLVLNLSFSWVPPSQFNSIGMRFCKLGKLGTGFPKWLQTQKNLLYLDISNVGISDAIPDWFWGLSPNLTYLNLSHNKINGQVPNLSLKFFHLSSVDLSFNKLEGQLPQFSSNVEILDLSKNLFSGTISFLCKTKGAYWSLYYLDLSRNLLSGELPDCWMYSEKLMVLNLANNNISGKIPHSMGSLTSLETLHLRNNSLSGELPLSLHNCKELISLDLQANRLCGKLPLWIGESLSNLKFLYLRSNEFEGQIPLQLCYLISLQILDLAQNNISGTIPWCLNNISAIAQIENSSNVIYVYSESYVEKGGVVRNGKEVEYSNNLRLIKWIDLSSNNLFGDIPIEITTLSGLQGLNLSRNHLTGSLPSMIGHLFQLESLDLSRNRLSGVIPPTLTNLTFLIDLDLSFNNLSGKIPLNNQLQSFNVSSYVGNYALCGPPLEVSCLQGKSSQGPLPSGVNDGDGFKISWFYVFMGLGSFVGFLGVCRTLLCNGCWSMPVSNCSVT